MKYGCTSIWFTAGVVVGFARQPLQVGDLEVGHPDAAGASVLLELLEGLPGRDEVAIVERRQRPVDEEQVDVVGAELLSVCVERASRVVGFVEAVVELAGDVHLGAVEAGVADALPDAALVLVHLRGIDVAIADVQRRLDGLGGVVGVDLKHAEAELWDACAVIEVMVGTLVTVGLL